MRQVEEREREQGPVDDNPYEASIRILLEEEDRQRHGEVVARWDERQWHIARQGRLKYLLHPTEPQTVLQHWKVFIQDIREHSGRHRHQGGLVIYVWEGRGYTIMDGERFDWEEGDVMILPIKPEGVEHQHFNADPESGCKWIAFIYNHWHTVIGETIKQGTNASVYKGS